LVKIDTSCMLWLDCPHNEVGLIAALDGTGSLLADIDGGEPKMNWRARPNEPSLRPRTLVPVGRLRATFGLAGEGIWSALPGEGSIGRGSFLGEIDVGS
jgi:hypothetical protein